VTSTEQSTQRVLPPDVSAADFEAALAEFRRIVGDEWVTDTPEGIGPYEDAFPVTDDKTKTMISNGRWRLWSARSPEIRRARASSSAGTDVHTPPLQMSRFCGPPDTADEEPLRHCRGRAANASGSLRLREMDYRHE
jgi:hypothetical protein